MASIENRSRFVVTVQNCEHFTRTFAYNREQDLKVYIAELKAAGYKPRLSRTNCQSRCAHRLCCLWRAGASTAWAASWTRYPCEGQSFIVVWTGLQRH